DNPRGETPRCHGHVNPADQQGGSGNGKEPVDRFDHFTYGLGAFRSFGFLKLIEAYPFKTDGSKETQAGSDMQKQSDIVQRHRPIPLIGLWSIGDPRFHRVATSTTQVNSASRGK